MPFFNSIVKDMEMASRDIFYDAMRHLDKQQSGHVELTQFIQCFERILEDTIGSRDFIEKTILLSGACFVHYESFYDWVFKSNCEQDLVSELSPESQQPLSPKHSATNALPVITAELKQVVATPLALDEVLSTLAAYVPDDPLDALIAEADITRTTIQEVTRILAKGTGGAIVAVVDGHLHDTLRFNHLDNGHLTSAFQAVASNLHEKRETFVALLDKFSEHSARDSWEHAELEELAEDFPDAAAHLGNLEGQPKDGAIVLSRKGNVMGAAGHLKYSSERFQLCKATGKQAGTRHNSSLAFAEWLGTNTHFGVIFVRSDDGGVHCILPRGLAVPQVYHFDSLRAATQEEMLELFRARVRFEGQIMNKICPVMARRARKGERIVTFTGDRVISDVVITDDSSMVVRSDSVDHEHYVLPKSKFDTNYAQPGIDLGDDEHELKGRGFKKYWPSEKSSKYMYEVTNEDMDLLPARSFMAPFGLQPVKAGDFLAMPAAPGVKEEIYLMPHHILKLYAVSQGGETTPRRTLNSQHHTTQEEMQELFRESIITRGELVTNSRPMLFRPAKLGERVVTCVQGEVTSDITVADEDSMVARGPAGELYVLAGSKFKNVYSPIGKELPEANGKDIFLNSQGFRQYTRRPECSQRFLYKIVKDDLKAIPTGFFESQWGALQPVHEGDYLAMMAPAEKATDIWVAPAEVAAAMGATL